MELLLIALVVYLLVRKPRGHGQGYSCNHKYKFEKADKMLNGERFSHLFKCYKCGSMYRTVLEKEDSPK